MPMLMTVEMRRPVWPRQAPERTGLGEARHLVEDGVDIGHDIAAVGRRWTVPAGARRATCSTARSSVTLMCSPAHMASIRSRRPARSATATRSPIVSAVSRFLE